MLTETSINRRLSCRISEYLIDKQPFLWYIVNMQSKQTQQFISEVFMNQSNDIGRRIQALRKERGMTQEMLAEKIGVSAQAVSKWENGYSCPDISVLPTLAAVLGITVDELLSGVSAGATDDGEQAGGSAVEGEFVADPENMGGKAKKKTKKGHSFTVEVGSGVSKFLERLWLGVFIVAAGVLLILSKATDILPCGFWSALWPTAIICLGLSGLTNRHVSIFSAGAVLIGTFFLLSNFAVIPENFSATWMVVGGILIVCGVLSLIPKKFRKRKYSYDGEHSVNDYSCVDGHIEYESSFGDNSVKFEGDTLRGGDIEVSFGAAKVDFTGVKEVSNGAVLEADVSFGSLELVLPRTIRVTDMRDTSFGAVNIKGSCNPDPQYALMVKSDVSFGSVEIIYR